MKIDLSGKRALVTGSSRGIGHAVARGLAEAGANLVLLARDPGRLAKAVDGLAYTGTSIEACAFDMADIDGIPRVYEKLTANGRGIDILVTNAGINLRGPAESVGLEDWETVMRLNVTSVFALCQAFARERIASGKKGKIITLASLMSESVREDNAPYATSKGAIRQMTKALAVDWAKHCINVNAVAPGYIRTEMTKCLWSDAQFDEWVRNRTPIGRWGEPADLAGLAVLLASDAADFITGQIIYVDGGWLARF